MARFLVHRLKTPQKESFKWAPHTGGLATVKPKDYELDNTIDADSTYSAWKLLQSEGRPLSPGDLLESSGSDQTGAALFIAKYIGFEPAQWQVMEIKSDSSRYPEPQIDEPQVASRG